jgi:hypothetical protein
MIKEWKARLEDLVNRHNFILARRGNLEEVYTEAKELAKERGFETQGEQQDFWRRYFY